MQNNRIPTLVVAAGADRIAPLPLVRLGYESLGGEKEWALFDGYGHTDLMMGDAARKNVWPVIDRFLGTP
jgi:poly(3-hydroxyalkanoate) synthetase